MRVFSNTAMSADGKIADHRYAFSPLGAAEDRRVMSVLRAQAEAVLIGGRTFRAWPGPLVENPRLVEPPVRLRPMLNVVLTRTGLLDADLRRLPDPRVQHLVLGPPNLDAEAHREALGAEVLTHPEPSVAWALDVLAGRGVRSVLIEGGGDIIFQALEADRLQEVYLTLCPLLIGGAGAPTPADGRGFEAGAFRRLSLQEVRRVEDELYLHYRVRPR